MSRIFDAASIEEVVGDYVKLKKAGANLKGLCPFHNEKTPSFSVSPAKGIYKCFGCGRAGNSVNFLMEYENLNYAEALRKLALRYGIPIEEEGTPDPEVSARNRRHESIGVALEYAKNFYAGLLWSDPQGKAIGYGYAVERGLRDDVIRTWEIGYSPDDRTAFLKAALQKGYELEILLEAGLIKEKENASGKPDEERYYDAFRDRLMFPVLSLTGKVLGFGGRRLKDGLGPKYLNSAETEYYHKSDILYGMHLAKKAIREKDNCLLVEGYLDVITLWQHDIQHVVASSGTSLTEGQIRVIKRFTENITVLYDADPAGIKASTRSINLVLEQGLNVNIAVLPEGEDPDTLCKKLGGKAFEAYLQQHALNFVTFKASQYSPKEINDPIGKTRAVRDVLESIVLIPDPLKRAAFIKECARLLDADERIMQLEASRMRKGLLKNDVRPQEEAITAVPPETTEHDFNRPEPLSHLNQEEALIKNIVLYANQEMKLHEEDEPVSVLQFVLQELELDEIELENELFEKLLNECREILNSGELVDEDFFIRHPATASLAADVLSEKYQLSPVWFQHYEIVIIEEKENYRKEILENLNHLKIRHLKKLIQANRDRIKEEKDSEELMNLLKIQKHLEEILKDLAVKTGIVVLNS